VAAVPSMLAEDRRRHGVTVGQVAWRLGVRPQEYRELEAGERFRDFDTWDRICKLFGWPQTFSATHAVPEIVTTRDTCEEADSQPHPWC
jgi:hypothetical protein